MSYESVKLTVQYFTLILFSLLVAYLLHIYSPVAEQRQTFIVG